jgi:hypothetical protein
MTGTNSDLDTSSSFHNGSATFVGKALDEDLKIELGGRRRQVLSDPDNIIPSGRLPISGALTDRDELWIHPRFAHSFGNAVSIDASYRLTEGRYDDPSYQDDSNQQAQLRLDNYSVGQGMTWALRYDRRKTEYDISPTWERQEALAELGWWVSGKTRIFASGGKESPWYDSSNPEMTESIWEAGVAYANGEDVSVELAFGDRSFGSTVRAKFDYAFRLGNMNITYDEIPTTVGFDTASRQAFDLDPDGLSDFISQPGNAESFIRKRLAWNLGTELRRLDIGLSAFAEDRTNRVRADGATLADQAQDGVSARLNWNVGSRTDFVITGRLVDRETGPNNKYRFKGLRLKLDYQLGTRSTLSLAFDRAEQEPDNVTASSQAYESNVVSILFAIGTRRGSGAQ